MNVAARMSGAVAAGLARTWRLQVEGEEHVVAARRDGIPIVFAVWHAGLLAPLWQRRGEGITLLVSSHRDGRRLADAARRWGYGIVEGSSTRGGVGGLRRLVRSLSDGRDAAVTPDGPRGPARRAKPGVVEAARLAGAVVVPVASGSADGWYARSWDRFLVPRPFATVRVVYGAPVQAVRRSGPRAAAVSELEEALHAAERRARCS